MDPNMLALVGASSLGNSNFTQQLMNSIQPQTSQQLTADIGPPSLAPLNQIAQGAPPIQQGYTQPALAPAQTLESLGFGMAGAAGKPGATGLSALGEGGTQMLNMGASASQRSISEAAQENNAAIQEWDNKSKIAEDELAQQMTEPQLDMKMLDLTGQSLKSQEEMADTAAYREALANNGAARAAAAGQNANTNTAALGIKGQNAETAAAAEAANASTQQAKIAQQQAALDQAASQFQTKLMQSSATSGARIGIEAAQAAATEFKTAIALRKDPVTGALPDPATQAAIQSEIAAKYSALAAPGGARTMVAPAAARTNPATFPYHAANKSGQMVYSQDGQTWVDAQGNPVGQ